MLLIRLTLLMLSTLCLNSSAFKAAFKASTSMRSMAMMAKKPAPDNPVAIVTGAARGIGKAIACALADTGCTVVVNYFANETQALEVVEDLKLRSGGKGGTAIAIRADCSNPAEVTAMFEEAYSKLGSVDIVINNAGITRDMLAIQMQPSDFTRVIDTNLNGVFYCAQAAFKTAMMRQKRGRIVNIASIIGQIGNPGQANYAAAKGGVIGLTRSLAKEFGSKGITVNAVCPGFIESDMTKELTNKEAYLATIPLKRFGTPEEVAGLVRFLATDPAAAYMTGHCLNIDGGLAIGAT